MDFSHTNLFTRSILTIGTIAVIISFIVALKNYSEILDGVKTKGRAIEYVKLDNIDNDNKDEMQQSDSKRYPRILFSDKAGKDYTFIDTNFSAMTKQQRTFDVIYNPENPNIAMVFSGVDVFAFPIIIFMTGLGCLVFGFTAYRIGKRQDIASNRLG